MTTWFRRLALALTLVGLSWCTPSLAQTPQTTTAKGAEGERLMNLLLSRSEAAGGLGMKKVFNPNLSKIARFGGAGGNGFDGVYTYYDVRSGQYRYVIAESKWGGAQLGEFQFDLLDELGKETGKQGRYFQGSKEWVQNVLRRMRVRGSPHDIAIGADVAQALQEKRLDLLVFKVSGSKSSRGNFEMGPVEMGLTQPRLSYGGAKGVWKLDKQGDPEIEKMKFGKVGCSDCQTGSRLFEDAVRRKLGDASSPYAALAQHDENVNPGYLVPDNVALDEGFRKYRTSALLEADTVHDALERLPEAQRPEVQKLLTARVEEQYALETQKSLADRQRHWQAQLSPEGHVKIQRTRSLVDELKGDSQGLKILQQAMAYGALAQLAWTYYEGGSEALLYAMGQMVVSGVQTELRNAFWIWTLKSLAAKGIATGLAEALIPMIQSGGLAAVFLAIDLPYRAGVAFGEDYFYGEQYPAEALLITGVFLDQLRKNFPDRQPPVTLTSLCDADLFRSSAVLSERLAQFETEHHYTGYPDKILEDFRQRIQSSWLGCEAREVASRFFDLPGELQRFCQVISTTEAAQARLGHIRTLIDPDRQLTEAQWSALTEPILAQHQACLEALPIREGLSATVEPAVPEDLARLDQPPAEALAPPAVLLSSDREELVEIERGGTAEFETQALIWGLPGTQTTIRLSSELQTLNGMPREVGSQEQTLTFEQAAYEPKELTQVVRLQDRLIVDEELAAGESVYTVRLFQDTKPLATRTLRLAPKAAQSERNAEGSVTLDYKVDGRVSIWPCQNGRRLAQVDVGGLSVYTMLEGQFEGCTARFRGRRSSVTGPADRAVVRFRDRGKAVEVEVPLQASVEPAPPKEEIDPRCLEITRTKIEELSREEGGDLHLLNVAGAWRDLSTCFNSSDGILDWAGFMDARLKYHEVHGRVNLSADLAKGTMTREYMGLSIAARQSENLAASREWLDKAAATAESMAPAVVGDQYGGLGSCFSDLADETFRLSGDVEAACALWQRSVEFEVKQAAWLRIAPPDPQLRPCPWAPDEAFR